MPIPLRVLIVENSENDAQLLVQQLGGAGYEVASRRVETRDAMAAALAQDTWDTVIADHSVPAFDAFGALETLQASGQDIPLIVVSGSIGEEAVAALMKAGATDYVMKDRPGRLTIVVPRELREAATRRERQQPLDALRDSETKYRKLYDLASDALFLIERETGRILEANAGATAMYGYSHEEWLTMRNVDVSVEPASTTAATLTGVTDIPVRWHRKKNGAVFPVDVKATHFEWQGRAVHLAAIRDATERVGAQEALHAERDRAESYLQVAGMVMVALDLQGKVTLINRRGCEVLGYTESELLGRDWFEVCLPPAERDAMRAVFDRLLTGGDHGLDEFENPVVTKSGEIRLMSWRNSMLHNAGGSLLGLLSSGEDITERRRAEDALREHERLMADAQAIAHFGSWSIDFNTGKVTWSKEMFRLYGLSPETDQPPTRLQFAELLHPDDRSAESAWSSQWRSGKPLPNLEFRTRPIHGAVRWLSNHGLLQRDANGNPWRFIGTVLDITDRKQAQAALRESEERHLTILQTAMDGFWQVDTEGRLLEVNETYCRMSGYTEQELLSMRIADLEAIESPDDTTARINKILAQGEARFESRHRRKDGTVFDVEISAQNRPAEGGRLVTFVRDITARKKAEEALRESEEFLTNLLDLAPVSIYVTGADGRVRMVNRRWEADTARQRSETLGRPLDQVFPPDTARRLAAENQQVVDQGVSIAFEQVIESPVEPHSFYTVKFPLRDALGQVDAVGGISVDITARKLAEETLRQSEASLREAQEIARIGRWEMNLATGRLSWSEGVFALFEISRETSAANYEAGLELIHPDDRAMVAQAYRESVDDKQPYEIEHRLLMPGGRVKWVSVIGRTEYDEAGQPIRSVGTVQDITTRKQSEETLRVEQERLDLAVSVTGLGLYDWNPKTGAVLFSERWAALFGYRLDELPDHPLAWSERVHPDDLPLVRKATQAAFRDGTPLRCEYRMRHRDGSWRWILDQGRIVARDAQGEVVRFVGADLDVTERRSVEEQLRHSEEDLRQAQQVAHVGSWRWDIKADRLNWSDEMYRIFDIAKEGFSGSLPEVIARAIHPDDRAKVEAADLAVSQRGKAIPLEYRVVWPDGTVRVVWAEAGELTRDEEGNPAALTGIVLDITDRKRAEEARRESDALLQRTWAGLDEAVVVVNLDTRRILMCSPAVEQVFGYRPEELVGGTMRRLHVSDESFEAYTPKRLAATGSDGVAHLEYQRRRKDGAVFWSENTVATLSGESGGPTLVVNVVRDITERRRAEEALRESEAHYHSLFDSMLNGYAYCRMLFVDGRPDDFVYLTVNPAFETLTGLKDVGGKKVSEVIPGIRETDQELLQAYGRVSLTGIPERLEIYVESLSMWFSISVYSPKKEHFVAVFDVITERKRAEEALRESEARLRDITFSMADWVWEVDQNGAYTYSSQKGSEFFGPPSENILGKTPFDLMPPDEAQRVAAIFSQIVANKAPIKDLENWNVTKSGERICLLTNGVPILDQEGNLKGYRGVDKDITERKRVEQQLAQSHELLANLARLVPGVVYQYRLYPDGRSSFPYASPGMNDIYEVTPEEVREDAAPVFGRLHPDDYARVAEAIQVSARTLQTFYCEFRVVLPRQGLRWRWSQAQPERMADGGTLWHGVISDVTERKRAEEALRQTERDLVDAQKLAGVGSWTYDPATQQPKWSEGMFRVWGLDPKLGAPSYADHSKYIHPDDYQQFNDAVQEAVQHGIPYQFDLRICRPDGSLRTITTICEPQCDADGSVVSLKGTVQDVTERKQAEDAIRASLREKELLLREIHHRVKNNLQIIASLLTLQAETVRNPSALEVFKDSQNRIRAMSLIHAKLYQSTDLATVDFGAFVRDLGTILLRAYAVDPLAIRLQVGAGRTDLAIDTVIPCSLIVNELLTNAIKYAFPSGAGGIIVVDLSQQEAAYTLRVADNGVGFPDSVDFRKTESLGLRLVILLVAQLDGTIELNNEHGAEFTIRFPTRASV